MGILSKAGRPKRDWGQMRIGSGRSAPTLDFSEFVTGTMVVVGA